MNKENIKNVLLNIGFSENEGEVYLFLIKNGPSSADPIIKSTGFHRNVVYTTLNHLLLKKVVSEKKQKRAMIFTALPLNYYAEKLKSGTEQAFKIINKIKAYTENTLEDVSIYEGNDEYLTLLKSLLNEIGKGGQKFVIGTGGEKFMENTMRKIWDEYHKTVVSNKICIKMIAYKNQKQSLEQDIEKYKEYYEIKYVDSQNENPAGIHIYPQINTVLNIVYSDEFSPVTAIKIRSSKLTEGYMNLFNSY